MHIFEEVMQGDRLYAASLMHYRLKQEKHVSPHAPARLTMSSHNVKVFYVGAAMNIVGFMRLELLAHFRRAGGPDTLDHFCNQHRIQVPREFKQEVQRVRYSRISAHS